MSGPAAVALPPPQPPASTSLPPSQPPPPPPPSIYAIHLSRLLQIPVTKVTSASTKILSSYTRRLSTERASVKIGSAKPRPHKRTNPSRSTLPSIIRIAKPSNPHSKTPLNTLRWKLKNLNEEVSTFQRQIDEKKKEMDVINEEIDVRTFLKRRIGTE